MERKKYEVGKVWRARNHSHVRHPDRYQPEITPQIGEERGCEPKRRESSLTTRQKLRLVFRWSFSLIPAPQPFFFSFYFLFLRQFCFKLHYRRRLAGLYSTYVGPR
ncbi:hypothetical protein L209DRAFT_323530 [Thermothelomyces heterothallicus CBS 203.75]